MKEKELEFAAELTAAEGWVSENPHTLEGFFLFDPQGCLVAEHNGIPVGMCIATCYGNSGFIGELIVRPEIRGKGVGALLLNHGVAYLKGRGADTIYLDGVLEAVDLYERNGFRKVCRSWRFRGNPSGKASHRVRHMEVRDLGKVLSLDRHAFRADRSFFLRRRWVKFPELSYVLVNAGRITGFILGRRGEDWLSAGPWVMQDPADNPAELLRAFALGSQNQSFSLGVLESNQKACDLLRALGFEELPDSPWRMALGTSEDLGNSPLCYAVGSAAKG